MGVRKRLEAALVERTLVRIELHPKHSDRVDGFVVGIGKRWVLVSATMDGGYFDGYQAFRLKDVERVRRDKSFETRFSQTQPEWPPSAPPVDLDSAVGVVRSLAAYSPLVGIEKNNERSGLWIGTLHKAGAKWVWLHQVASDGHWYDEPLGYRTKRITNVQVANHYMTALAEIAGDQPPVPTSDSPEGRE